MPSDDSIMSRFGDPNMPSDREVIDSLANRCTDLSRENELLKGLVEQQRNFESVRNGDLLAQLRETAALCADQKDEIEKLRSEVESECRLRETAKDFELALRLVRQENDALKRQIAELEKKGASRE